MTEPFDGAAITEPGDLLTALSGLPRIVFDLDGTLYDTRDFERPALASVVEWLRMKSGLPLEGMSRAFWSRRETDRHRPCLFDDLLFQYGLPVSWGGECARRFRDYPGTELRHAESLKIHLEALRSTGCRLALVSNGYAELQNRKLTLLAMRDAFDLCIYCNPRRPDQLKPSTWAWTQLAGWCSSRQAIYVGDDPVDAGFASAGGAGFISFRFRSPAYEN